MYIDTIRGLIPHVEGEVIDISDEEDDETYARGLAMAYVTRSREAGSATCFPGGPEVDLWMVLDDGTLIPQV